MYLADMGADVIKVENLTTGGNFVRNARPLEKNSGLSMYFQNLNRNKRGVAINLKTEDGKKLFSELVKSADVLLENNRPGVMGRLGFSYEECKKLNPRLVYASISGFGQYGPNANRPGYDLIGQAMGGSMSITGWPGSEPTRAGMAIGDLFGGLNAGFAICASLYNREKTGVGNHIDVALVDSIFSGMEAKMMQYVYTGVSPVKTGNKYITSAPYDSFKAKDDYFVIASGTSTTQVGSLADEVEFALSQKGIEPISTEGFDSKNWVLLDYSSVIVHVFVPNTRTYYDLEHLWADGEPMDISEYLTPENSL